MSNNSWFFPILIHCFCLVTPGLLPTSAVFFLAILLINDDLPTLGIPSIITLIVLFFLPRAACLASSSCINSSTFLVTLSIPFPVAASVNIVGASFESLFTHIWLTFWSAKSHLLSKIIFLLLFVILFISGFLLDTGILASKSSITTSINFKSSIICFLVFAICPGYQLIFIFPEFCSIYFTSFTL